MKRWLPLLLAAAFILSIPLLTQDSFYLTILIYLGINLILVLGLTLLMGYAGQISLGHAALYGVGAYVSAYLSTKLSISFWLCLFIAAIFGGIAAYFIGLPALRLKGHYLAMATLGFGEIMSVLFAELRDFTGGVSGFLGIPSPTFFGLDLSYPERYFYLTWFWVFAVFLLSLNLAYSQKGRELRALHDSEVAAKAVGINVSRHKIFIFVLSGFFSGLAGSLYAHYTNFISPESFTLTFSIILVTMVVLGGMRHIWGGVMGAVILTVLMEYFRSFQDYSLILSGLLLILLSIFAPEGIFSIFEGRAKKWLS